MLRQQPCLGLWEHVYAGRVRQKRLLETMASKDCRETWGRKLSAPESFKDSVKGDIDMGIDIDVDMGCC